MIWAPIEKFKELIGEGYLTPTLRRISDVLLSGERVFKLWAACCMTEKSHPASLAPRKAAGSRPSLAASEGTDELGASKGQRRSHIDWKEVNNHDSVSPSP
jgi:hypothetical protein